MEKDTMFEAAEIELLEFKAGGNFYGVNVNDIREILSNNYKLTPVPNAHPYIEGMIMPRDFIIPIINLLKSLKLNDTEEAKMEMLIVSSINNLNIAFHVDRVLGIHRVASSEVTKPGKKVSTPVKNVIIGVLNKEDKKIEIIDFRKIITEINPNVNLG
jgi:chemotaxis signal transduction protein